jgi:DNA-binding HxlR family transcriptional regulator
MMLEASYLAEGERFGQLQRELGMTQKVLTQTLRDLEREGVVQCTVYPVVPPKVEYRLTDLGATLIDPLTAFRQWAEAHLPEVEAARARQAEPTAR